MGIIAGYLNPTPTVPPAAAAAAPPPQADSASAPRSLPEGFLNPQDILSALQTLKGAQAGQQAQLESGQAVEPGIIPPWVNAQAMLAVNKDSPYNPPTKDTGFPTPWGFLGNAAGDVTEFAKGLAALVGAGAGDVYNAAAGGVDFLQGQETDRDFKTDDILKALVFDPTKAKEEGLFAGIAPGLVEDLKARYGSPSKIASTLYNDPLFVAADISAVGEGAGLLAKKSAEALLAKPLIRQELEALGKIEGELLKKKAGAFPSGYSPDVVQEITRLDDLVKLNTAALSPDAARVKSVLPGAGIGKLDLSPIEALGFPELKNVPLGGLKPRLTNLSGNVRGAWDAQAANPWKRMTGKLSEPLTTQPLKNIEGAMAEDIVGGAKSVLKEDIFGPRGETTASSLVDDVASRERILKAAKAMGMKRVDRQWYSNLKTQKMFDKLSGMFVTRFYGKRDLMKDSLADRITKTVNSYAKKQGWDNVRAQAFVDNEIGLHLQVATPSSPGAFDEATMQALERTRKLTNNEASTLQSAGVRVNRDHMAVQHMGDDAPIIGRKIEEALPGARYIPGAFDDATKTFSGGYVVMPDSTLVRVGDATSLEALKAIDEIGEEISRARQAGAGLQDSMDEVLGRAHNQQEIVYLDDSAALLSKRIKMMEIYKRQLATAIAYTHLRSLGASLDDIGELVAGLRVDVHRFITGPSFLKLDRFREMTGPLQGVLKMDELMKRSFVPLNLETYNTRGIQVVDLIKQMKTALAEDNPARVEALRGDLKTLGLDTLDTQFEGLMKMEYMPKDIFLDELLLQELKTAGGDLTEKFMDAYLTSGRQLPLYFPHLDPELFRPSGALFNRTQRMGHGANTARFKENQGWLYAEGGGKVHMNPLDVYTRTATDILRYTELNDFKAATVQNFGRAVRFHNDWAPHEKLFAPGVFKQFLRHRAQVEVEAVRNLINGATPNSGESWMKAMQDAMKKVANQQELDELYANLAGLMGEEDMALAATSKGFRHPNPAYNMRFETMEAFDTFAKTEMDNHVFAIPEVVAKRLDQASTLQLGWKATVFWDTPLDIWRSAVLAFSPRWVFYNLLGNMTFLKMQGGSLYDAFKLMTAKTGRKLFGEEFMGDFLAKHDAMLARLKSDHPDLWANLQGGFFSNPNQKTRHLGSVESMTPGEYYAVFREGGLGKVRSGFGTAAQKVRQFNESIEESFRTTAFINAAEKKAAEYGTKAAGRSWVKQSEVMDDIARNGIDEGLANKALEEVNYFFNDYSSMGPIERNVIRRFIAPFYSFYKHIWRLVITYPFTTPLRAQVVQLMGQFSEEMMAQYGPMPDWLVGSVPIGKGEGEDETRFLNTRGANPFNALLSPLESIGTSIAPPWKIAMEQITGRSLLTGKPFTSPDSATPFGMEQSYRVDPVTGMVDPTTVRPNLLQHILSQFPQFQLGQNLYSAATEGGAGARYGTGELLANPGGGPLYPSNLGLDVLAMGGLSTTDFGLEKYQTRDAEGQRQALIQWLKRNGYLAAEAQTGV